MHSRGCINEDGELLHPGSDRRPSTRASRIWSESLPVLHRRATLQGARSGRDRVTEPPVTYRSEMRIGTWNCRLNIDSKRSALDSLALDLAVVPEIPRPPPLRRDRDSYLRPRSHRERAERYRRSRSPQHRSRRASKQDQPGARNPNAKNATEKREKYETGHNRCTIRPHVRGLKAISCNYSPRGPTTS